LSGTRRAPGSHGRQTVRPLTCLARGTALAGYFGLLGLLTAWYAVIEPSTRFPVALTLIFLVGPLLFPLLGLLHGRPYTHAWTSFLALFYFTGGVFVYAGGVGAPWLPGLQIVLSLLLFAGCIVYARLRGIELKTAPG